MSLNVARLADRQAGRRRRRVLAAILAAVLAAVAAFVHLMDVREASRHRARIEAYQLAHYASARPWQQATDQVSQQCFVGADWSVHTARTVQLAIGNLAYDLLVQRFAHAVQALELVLAGVIVLTGDMVDG